VSHETLERPRWRFLYAGLIGIAGTIAGLGSPSLLSAAPQTIVCDAPPLIANPPQLKAHLGWSLSLDGDWLAAGAIHDNTQPGSVSMYKNPGTRSVRISDQEIVPNVPRSGDQFGFSVSINFSNNGYWLAVGAPGGDGRVQDSGVVYLFQLKDGAWSKQAKLDAGDAARGAQFGFSVSLSGTTLVVGAPGDSGGGSFAGAAYVFEMPTGISGPWSQKAKLLANDFRPFDKFGSAVATDGNEIVVGSPFADDLHVFKNFGAAYVFKRIGVGWTLENQGKLTAADTIQGNNIQFGASVAIRGDRIVVGAPGDDQGPTDSGSAYVFERGGANWVRHQPALTSADPGQSEQFGTAVLIADNDRVVIGAPFDGAGIDRPGAAYLFEKSNDIWNQKFKILHTPGGAFGQSVAIHDDQVFMGGFQYDGPFGERVVTDAGAVAVCSSGPPMPKPVCTKTGPSSVAAGDLAVYTVVVSNEGEAAATGVILNDLTPAGLTLVSVSGGTCTQLPCSLGMIAAHGSLPPVKVTFQVPEDCSGPTSIQNSATVTDDRANTFTCTPAAPTTVLRPPVELSCNKEGPSSANPGDIVTYDITVNNSGCGAAENVTLSDPTPAGLTYVSGPCVLSPCNLGTIDPNLPQTVTVRFQVPANLVPPVCPTQASATNITKVVGSNAPASFCSITTVFPIADLGVSVSAPPGVPGGNSFPVTVVVTNSGPQTAEGVTVDVFIADAGVIDSFPGSCTHVGSQPDHFICILGNMNCGDSKPLIFSIRAPSCVNCAAGTPIGVTAEAKSPTFDPTLPNQAMATIPVTCTPVPVLAITKEDAPDPVASGAELQYTITVKNVGCLDVLATVKDVFPAGLTNVRWCRETGGPCNPSQPGDLNDTLPLAVGASAVYLAKGTVVPICGTLVNTATVSAPPSSATATTEIFSPPGVSIQCHSPNGAFEGDFVTFTYVLSNGGPNAQADNPGAEFTDTLPAGLTLVTATASSGTVTTALSTVSWNGSIPVCGTVTISVQAKVDPLTVGMTLCSQGNVTFDADGDGINESNASDTCCVKINPDCTTTTCIPTLGPAGLAALVILLACVALLRLRRRSP